MIELYMQTHQGCDIFNEIHSGLGHILMFVPDFENLKGMMSYYLAIMISGKQCPYNTSCRDYNSQNVFFFYVLQYN